MLACLERRDYGMSPRGRRLRLVEYHWTYFTGGGTAVLVDWRAETADADLLAIP
jgi:hypothetical protein